MLKTGDIVYTIRENKVLEVEFIRFNKKMTGGFFKTKECGAPILVSFSKLYETYERAQNKLKSKLGEMKKFKIGDNIYFDYSKYYQDREGVIADIRTNTYIVSFSQNGKTILREVAPNKIRKKKLQSTINREKEREKISEICHKIWLEFDIEIPLLSQPYSIEEAEKLYKRIKRDYEYEKYILEMESHTDE